VRRRPAAFSRHATVHSISPQQYTECNSLASLLLLVAFIRELDLLPDAQGREVTGGGNFRSTRVAAISAFKPFAPLGASQVAEGFVLIVARLLGR
jgi:hypothetical protein